MSVSREFYIAIDMDRNNMITNKRGPYLESLKSIVN